MRRPIAVVTAAMLVVVLLGTVRHARIRGWLGCALIDAGAHVLPDPAERLMARQAYARWGLP